MIGGTSRIAGVIGGGDGFGDCFDDASFDDVSDGGEGYISQSRMWI